MFVRRFVGVLALVACTLPLWAQTKIDAEQKHLLLATSKTSTMQKELDAAAASGFRVVVGSGIEGNEIALLLERLPADAAHMSYKLLATSQTNTMEKELNAAAQEGFRIVPQTLTSKKAAFIGPEILVVMEKDPAARKVSYKLLATTRTGTLQKEITQTVAEGYMVVGMVSRGEHMVILEREIK